VNLPPAELIAIDSAAWVFFYLAASFFTHSLPLSYFDKDNRLYRLRSWEQRGGFYRRILAVHLWKKLIPDFGDLFRGGFPKRCLQEKNRDYLRLFLLETRRGEFTHWLSIAFAPLFFLWNPWIIAVFMIPCAFIMNLPLVAIQRFNRARLAKTLSFFPF